MEKETNLIQVTVGRASLEQRSVIKAALCEWCEQRAVDPEGMLGLDALRAMTAMYQSGKIWRHELLDYAGRLTPLP